jgi:hypothetical protein
MTLIRHALILFWAPLGKVCHLLNELFRTNRTGET